MDANGCETCSSAVTTPALNPPTDMDITGTLIYCAPPADYSTVTINTVTATVWVLYYQMLSPSIINNGPSNSFAGLVAGDYMFQVTDSNGCTYQELYTGCHVWRLRASTTDVTCFEQITVQHPLRCLIQQVILQR
jgi:hypothetical protein